MGPPELLRVDVVINAADCTYRQASWQRPVPQCIGPQVLGLLKRSLVPNEGIGTNPNP